MTEKKLEKPKALKILTRFADSPSFYDDLNKMFELTDEEVIKILELHLRYSNSKARVSAVLESIFSKDKLSNAEDTSFFIGRLLQEGSKKKSPIEDYSFDLKALDFRKSLNDEIIKKLKAALPEFLEKMVHESQVELIVPDFCNLTWRLINVTADWTGVNRATTRIEICISYHDQDGDHKYALFDCSPEEFEDIKNKILVIEEVLKSA